MLIVCATVMEEMLPHLPTDVSYRVLDFGLHVDPEALKSALQKAIDDVPPSVKTILLGYGLCSMAVVGLASERCQLVVPRVDDCIAIFLGSGSAYKEQRDAAPGTYYLTKGWIEAGDLPFAEYERLVVAYGEEKARWVMGRMFNRYTRLALINTGQYALDHYRRYCRRTAARFGLDFEEIPGSDSLVCKLLHGPWDDDFVVASPGHVITFRDFVESF
jgi:hypothetical protein